MWVLLLVACGGERFTGRFTSSTSTSLAAVPVSLGRQAAQTDSNGRFSFEPGSEATFVFGGVSWRTDATAGEHDLKLPVLRHVLVRCPADDACQVALRWPDVGSLRPGVELKCTPGASFELDAPRATPEAACEHPERALVVDDRDEKIELWPSGREVDITLVASNGAPLPEDCATWVDGVRASPVAPGRWAGQARGNAWVGGQCGDRPIAPVLVPRDGLDAALSWSLEGPDWDPKPVAPWARELQISDQRGLSVVVKPVDGVFHLPPLPPGDWRVTVTGEDPKWGTTLILPQPTEDGMTLNTGGERVSIGVWRVPDPPVTGAVPSRG